MEEKKTTKEGSEKKKKRIAFAVAVRNYPPGCQAATREREWELRMKGGAINNNRRSTIAVRGRSCAFVLKNVKGDPEQEEAKPEPEPEPGGAKEEQEYEEEVEEEEEGDSMDNDENLSQPATLSIPVPLTHPVTILVTSSPRQLTDRTKILQILKKFDALRRHFMQEQEQERGAEGSKAGRRPDIKAASLMRAKKEVSFWRGLGPVPGVNVGDCYFYRNEILVVGLHNQVQAGIAWIGKKNESLCTSVVASGGYEDDEDNGDTLVYTGQGGNNYAGDKRQGYDQKPEKGNLALLNSWKQKTPVRVIRGHSNIANSPSGKVYSYDGLYMVEDAKVEAGAAGFNVFKFFLRRIPGQPELGSNVVKFMGRLNAAPSQREGVLVKDVSNGKESKPVVVVNTVDKENLPEGFKYTSKLIYPSKLLARPPSPAVPCNCNNGCHGGGSCCLCVEKNVNGMLPYNHDGNLVRARPIVYECGPKCKCSQGCYNRVTQKGLRHRLEIFKTLNKGWGVRSWDFIPAGGFVCEYTGELLDTQTANELDDDEYLFNLDVKEGIEARWGDVSDDIENLAPDASSHAPMAAAYVIDASKHGGVARFINHSCEPNLFVQCVLYDHHDLRIPHIMLFASSNIPPFRELTYDYAYVLDSVYDTKGLLKQKPCYCGAPNCRRRLY